MKLHCRFCTISLEDESCETEFPSAGMQRGEVQKKILRKFKRVEVVEVDRNSSSLEDG